ncbi:hypothetical protein CROQUDRAFT_661482 [Cronartium quercuum f. sp. fusiforme G11]|uniref:DUF1746 domain-containing protein n=1 Tax=Cronartium quercuum f. sp. fusiforme G11 TaxID=708437 RepID=A0A9P6T8M1_9BASI|nr:hypothetical protein CROQUDRAFT_661482 [Cronartium quercuum f. sp. fusiforme G11]
MDAGEVMRVVPNPEDANSRNYSSADAYQKAMILNLIYHLEQSFYATCYLSYLLDGMTVIFLVRTLSEVQFSQPKQIQPDRSLRFFTILSLTISISTFLHHLFVPSNPSGVFLDFIGSSQSHRWSQGLRTLALVVFDFLSCSLQLLHVLLTFTQSHQIPLDSVLLFPTVPSTNSSTRHHQSPCNSPTTVHPEDQDRLEEGQHHQYLDPSDSGSLFTLELRNFFTILLTTQIPQPSPPLHSSPSSVASLPLDNHDESITVTADASRPQPQPSVP